ncbi:type II toxin-antitoxin system HicA family toxin [Methanocalculus sp. MC3]
MKIIQKRGFLLDRVKGSHHIFFHPETKRRVIIPFHKRELPVGTLIEILKQAGIKRDEIEELP